MKSIKPVIKWAGGKRLLIPTLEKYLPSLDGAYYEPFLGGGALFFYLAHRIKEAYLSDLNSDLVELYKVIQSRPLELNELLRAIEFEYSKADKYEYYLSKRKAYNADAKGIERTAIFVFLNKACFNGMYRVNRRGEFNTSFGKAETLAFPSKKTLLETSEVLQKAVIQQQDFSEVIVKPGSFIYFDPPYRPISRTARFNQYCSNGFTDKDQKRLAEYFQSLSEENHLMLSNSDTGDGFFENLYSGNTILYLEAIRSLNPKGNRKAGEILVLNY